MSIEHHPDDSMLAAFAAGTLDHGQHVAIATHLVSCPQCRAFMRSMEQVGGAVLTGLPPAAMSNNALAKVEAQLNEPVRPTSMADHSANGAGERGSWTAEILASLPVRQLEVDRALGASAANRAALFERDTGLPAQVRPGDQNAGAHAHRD